SSHFHTTPVSCVATWKKWVSTSSVDGAGPVPGFGLSGSWQLGRLAASREHFGGANRLSPPHAASENRTGKMRAKRERGYIGTILSAWYESAGFLPANVLCAQIDLCASR